jgi:hypothetical protein
MVHGRMVKRLALLWVTLTLVLGFSYAQSANIASVKGVALVIGNATYTKVDALTNPVNDAVDMAKTLTDLGWDVVKAENASLAKMRSAMREFGAKLPGKQGAFFIMQATAFR